MACLNCDHTMQKAGDNGGRSVFWCPRCGTLKMEGAVPEFETPTNNHLWPITNIKATPAIADALQDARRAWLSTSRDRNVEMAEAMTKTNRALADAGLEE